MLFFNAVYALKLNSIHLLIGVEILLRRQIKPKLFGWLDTTRYEEKICFGVFFSDPSDSCWLAFSKDCKEYLEQHQHNNKTVMIITAHLTLLCIITLNNQSFLLGLK